MVELEFHIGLYRKKFTDDELKDTQLITIINAEDRANGVYELRMDPEDRLILVEYSMGVLTFSAYIYKVGVDRENQFILHSPIWLQDELETAYTWVDSLMAAQDVANAWLLAIALGDISMTKEARVELTEFFLSQRRIAYDKVLQDMHASQLALFSAYQRVLSNAKPDPKAVIFEWATMPDAITLPNDTDVPDAFKEYMQ